MNWWERQISLGWKGPRGRPRGSSDAEFPLKTRTRYFVPMDGGKKSHLLLTNTDHAYCGLTLTPEDGWLIDSGYDAWYWIVEDHDPKMTHYCKQCSHWKTKFAGWKPNWQLPTTSPVTADEWQQGLGPELEAQNRRLDSMATVVCGWIGQGARVVREQG